MPVPELIVGKVTKPQFLAHAAAINGKQPADHTWTAGLAVRAGQILEHSGALYKVDADMTLPGTFDTTGLTSVGGGSGGTVAYPSGAPATTVPRPMLIDPRDHGVTADGVIDDTASLQAALDAAVVGVEAGANDRAANTVQLPPGNIKITAPLLLPANVMLRGHGPSSTYLRGSLPLLAGKTQPVLALATGEEVQVELREFGLVLDPKVDGIVLSQSGGASVLGDSRHVVEDIVVVQGSTALALEGNTECRVDNFTAQRCTAVAERSWQGIVWIGGSDHMIGRITVAQPDGSIGVSPLALHTANTRAANLKVFGGTGGGAKTNPAISVSQFRNQVGLAEVQDYNGPGLALGASVCMGLVVDSCAGPSLMSTGVGTYVRGALSLYRGGGAYAPQYALELNDGADVEMIIQGAHAFLFDFNFMHGAGSRIRLNYEGATVVQSAYAATYTPDALVATTHILAALTGALTIADPSWPFGDPERRPLGEELEFVIPQDATGGRVVTFGSAYKTTGAVVTTASSTTTVGFRWDGTYWRETARSLT